MNVTLTGATGFIGRRLVASLRSRGDRVTSLSRDPSRARALLGEEVSCVAWEPAQADGTWESAISGSDAVVHLAGEPVMARRWTADVKAAIRDSRVMGTRHIVDAIARAPQKPAVFVCASGMDFYGDTGDTPVDESSAAGTGFLSEVCQAWETEAARAGAAGVREVRLRIGLVVGESGGALEKMLLPFKMFVGGPVGGSRQWVSWIHLEDMVRLIVTAIDDARLRGPVNAVAPESVRMLDFAVRLGVALHRPSWLPVPRFVLRIAVGEAGAVLAESKRLEPGEAKRVGFAYCFPTLSAALSDAVDPKSTSPATG